MPVSSTTSTNPNNIALSVSSIGPLINAIRNAEDPSDIPMLGIKTAEALDVLQNFAHAFGTAVAALSSGSSSSSGSGYATATGTTFTPVWTTASVWELNLTGNATINPTIGGSAGSELTLILVQDATGGRQVTSWDASYLFGATFGLDPTGNTATVFVFVRNNSAHWGLKSAPVTGIPWP